jgi:serine/threonine protein kinase/tetratricopeptide (TPR) repeat protein
MGEVYRARDVRLGRSVAIKVLGMLAAHDAEVRERFSREARVVSSLNHPNICALHDVGEQDGVEYLVMEYIEGETLATRLMKGALPLEEALRYAEQIADALDQAHQHGVVHRDLKPGNIMLTRSGAKLLDFGLAKLRPVGDAALIFESGRVTAHTALTTHGTMLGTYQYMSPEQLEGGEADERSDIFAFGAVLYEMCTGKRAFEGRTQASVIAAILTSAPPPMSSVMLVPPPQVVEEAIRTCLEKYPAERWQSAHDLREHLRQLTTGAAPASVLQSAAAPAVAPRRREIAAWGTAAVAIVGLAAVTMFVLFRDSWRIGPADATPAGESASIESAAGASPLAARPPMLVAVPLPTVRTHGPAAIPTPSASTLPSPPGSTPAPPSGSTTPDSTTRPAASPAPSAAPSAGSPAPAANRAEMDLVVARGKADARLYDQALADLQRIVVEYAGQPAASEGYFLIGQVRERQGRAADAQAAYLELTDRYPTAPRAPEALFRAAQLVLQSDRPAREKEDEARKRYSTIAEKHPGSTHAMQALLSKAELEERRRVVERNATLGVPAPAALATYHRLVELFPSNPSSEKALWRLGEMYEDLRRYEQAAAALTQLGELFPQTRYDAWYRAGEFYERRLKDRERAAAAYGRVPPTSSNYKEAQRRAARLSNGS